MAQGIEAGTVLPSERELTKAYGVSRGTLREALRILESHGFLTIRQGSNGGPVLQPPEDVNLVGTLSFVLKLRGTSLSQVVEARLIVEPLTAGLAASRATEEEIAEMGELVKLMARESENEFAFFEYNKDFHEMVASMAKNPPLAAFATAISSIIDGHRAGVEYTSRRLMAVNKSHERLFEAICARDPQRARNEAEEHLREFRAYLEHKYPDLILSLGLTSDASGYESVP